jgi:hypothetical protein
VFKDVLKKTSVSRRREPIKNSGYDVTRSFVKEITYFGQRETKMEFWLSSPEIEEILG